MRKPLLCGTSSNNISINSKSNAAIKVEDMSGSGVPNFDVVIGETRVDRVRKILSSPLTKKKPTSNVSLTFGVPLDNQQQRKGSGSGVDGSVPFFVHRICDYIECNGFHHEGLFRISGSVRTMEKLRSSFDRNGDADLEDTADVMAAAGLLKQFLLALPEPVVPTSMHAKFLKVQKEYCHPSNEECIRQLKRLVEQLPEPNFNLLKYLMGFLVKVSAAEQYNRMNANSLGIVFGPSVFRVADIVDVEGLKEQSIANQIVTKFVRDYSAIFEVDTSAPVMSTAPSIVLSSSSSSTNTVSRRKSEVDTSSASSSSSSAVQQNDKTKATKECVTALKLEASKTAAAQTGVPMSFSSVLDSPKDVQFEDNRNKVIEMTISNAVCRNLYGENSGQDKLRPPMRLKHKKLELSPDGAANNKLARSNSEERSTSDKQRQQQHQQQQQHHTEGVSSSHGFGGGLTVRKCCSHEEGLDTERLTAAKVTAAGENKPRQQHDEKTPADNTSLKKFDSGHGGNLSQAMTPLNIDTSTQAIPDLRKRDWGRHQDGENDCSEARRSMERLQNFSQFQRSTVTSKVRRPATLKGSRRCASMEVVRNDDADDDSLKENFGRPSSCGDRSRMTKPFQKRSSSLTLVESPTAATMDDDPMRDELDLDETEVSEDLSEALQTATRKDNATDVGDPRKPRLWLLDLHDVTPVGHQDDQRMSPNASTQKSYVPPLDLATLHEHGDGSDPIPTNHLRASWPFIHTHQAIYDEVMLSPRTNSLEKMSSAFVDSNVPPSPPFVQDISRKSASFKDEEEREASFRILNKKISSLKRKIKQYEDDFEDDYGYRPSHAEKMSQSEIKKYMSDLAKARKELKQLKEEARLVTMATSFSLSGGQMRNGVGSDVSLNGKCCKTPAMEASLDEMMRKVSCKRRAANRPESLEDMSGEEVLEEKLVIQKALLHFENIHGRPVTKQEKELMKPIYERYRNVKRLAAKASSPKMKDPSMELQPILEHETMDFTQASPKHQRFPPGEDGNDDTSNDNVDSSRAKSYDSLDAAAGNAVFPDGLEEDVGGEAVKITSDDPEIRTAKRTLLEDSCNLHALSHKELLEQEWKVRSEKKRLRRILREFEDGFQRQTGRKAQREDRVPIDSVYLEYKQVKAKLKLLEALLTKHEHHYTI